MINGDIDMITDTDNAKQYEEYLDSWLNGIQDEIKFWDLFFQSKGSVINGCTEDIFNEVTAYAPAFTLEDDICKTETKFLDAGSGPYSRCGVITNKTKLDFTAVDPLASIYKALKDKHSIDTKIQPQTAMVENLSSKFKENEFDIVHMSNSLDHSFDPILGLWQMLYVCKVGGKIILRHHQNEAENENYQGFHQWNLSLENNKFIIWRPGIKFDVSKILSEYAEIIETKKDVIDNQGMKTWVYDKVVIRKNKPTPLHFNENYPLLLEKFLDTVCRLNFNLYKNNQDKKHEYKNINLFGVKIKLKK